MRAVQCTCVSPPHRYIELDDGTVWFESASAHKWHRANNGSMMLDGLHPIDPEPVWADCVRAQMLGETDV